MDVRTTAYGMFYHDYIVASVQSKKQIDLTWKVLVWKQYVL